MVRLRSVASIFVLTLMVIGGSAVSSIQRSQLTLNDAAAQTSQVDVESADVGDEGKKDKIDRIKRQAKQRLKRLV